MVQPDTLTGVRVTAKVDYAVRAAMELGRPGSTGPVKGDHISHAQSIPVKFLENILSDLKRGGLVASQRGADGGYWLARPPEAITVADVIRAVEGPLAAVRGVQPQDLDHDGDAAVLQRMWVATARACGPCSSTSRSRISPVESSRRTSTVGRIPTTRGPGAEPDPRGDPRLLRHVG